MMFFELKIVSNISLNIQPQNYEALQHNETQNSEIHQNDSQHCLWSNKSKLLWSKDFTVYQTVKTANLSVTDKGY
jgi:hypothetical protein